MKYQRAEEVLPEELIIEIQKYTQGQVIYIPKTKGRRRAWGETTGNRLYLKDRNKDICSKFKAGSPISELADEYCLSIYSIRKIVYTK